MSGEILSRYRGASASAALPWCSVAGQPVTVETIDAHLRNTICSIAQRIAELRGCDLVSVDVKLREKSR